MAKANLSNTLVVPEASKTYPYFDDFSEDKNFHRILFRPGFPVQGRELTQLQTILQNQIERFGRHIFVNGSSVIGGEVVYSAIATLNLATQYANSAIDVSAFKDQTIRYTSGNNKVIAHVIETTDATDTDPPSIYVRYITGDEFGPGDTIKLESANVYANVVGTANAKSNSYFGFIHDSVFFYDGYFVRVPRQSIVVNKYNLKANTKVGLEKDDSIVLPVDDASLLDPALESSNYQAPGAARYKLDLVLAKRDLDSTDDSKFIEITRIENGVIKKNITTPVYSEIEEVLARRTYDQAGNYTVSPFIVTVDNNDSDPTNNLTVTLSAGKAYIYGFEYETLSDTEIVVPKARTKANVQNYNLIMNFGNYVTVNNVMGAFSVSTMGLFDIHSVPYQYIDYSAQSNYNRTKIGTARVKDLEFFSGDTDATSRSFEFYFFDPQFTSITANASSTSNSTYEVVLNNTSFSANDNAYLGATIKVNAGPGVGESKKIAAWNGATKRANTSTPFSTLLTTASNVSVQFDFGEAESFVQHSVFTSGNPANANCNITTLSKDDGTQNGVSVVTEVNLEPLVFQFPNQFIAYGSITDQTYEYRRVFSGVQFTSGNSTALISLTDEDFVGTTTSSNVSSVAMDNFLVVCTNNQGGSRANGEQIKVTTSVTAGTPEQATLFTGGGGADTFLATVYAKVRSTLSAATPRVKTLVTANSTYFSSVAPSNTFINSTGSNTSVYLASGQVMIKSPSKIPGTKESLFVADVIGIKKIYDLNGTTPSAGQSLAAFTDVTDRYTFDNGQKDTFYDHASIALKPGRAPAAGPLVVCFRYYSTTTDKGYFSVDSYPSLGSTITEEGTSLGTGYSLIPKYRTYTLRDCIDFRPVRQNASNTALYTLSGIKIPLPASDFNTDYQYYLGRYDIITLNANRQLGVIQGIPAIAPQYPTAPSKAMVLNTLYIAPYTDYPANVAVKYMDTKRYTMRDIGLIDKRVQALEYYVSLTALEKNALDYKIADVDGLDRPKYGIFVDGFTGHSLGDSTLDDYKIAVDVNGRFTGDGMAIPQFAYGSVPLDLQSTTSAAIGFDRITLDYTEEDFIVQDVATKFIAVADYLWARFLGALVMLPEADIWRDLNNITFVNVTNTTNESILSRTQLINNFTENGAIASSIGEQNRFAVQGTTPTSQSTGQTASSDSEIQAFKSAISGSGRDWFMYNGS